MRTAIMEKKDLIKCLLFVALLTSVSLAADCEWTNAAGNRLWSDGANWIGGVPVSSSYAFIGVAGYTGIDGPIIDYAAESINTLRGPGYQVAGASSLDIVSGGSLTVTGGNNLFVGRGTGTLGETVGTLTIEAGGLLNIPAQRIVLGRDKGIGIVNINGGILIMSGKPNTTNTTIRFEGGGPSKVNLNDGYIILDGVMTGLEFATAGGSVDISGGALFCINDITSSINNYLSQDRITANGGDTEDSLVRAVYKNGYTVVSLSAENKAISMTPSFVEASHDVVLNWLESDAADEHCVYLGTDFNDVNNATDPNVFPGRGIQTETSYDPQGLEFGQTYYWRVDEYVDGDPESPYKGDIWQIKISDYTVIDDMESYSSSTELATVWEDGYGNTTSGSEVYLVEGQHMGVVYDNSGSGGDPCYSEVTRTFASPKNWSIAKSISLWFCGTTTNSEEQMYVALDDGSTFAVVFYDGLSTDMTDESWHNWNIRISDFNSLGIDLSNITKMCIGIGNRLAPSAGGTGVVLFDDIRLYPTRCISEYVDGDFTGDCIINMKDFCVFALDWLHTDFYSDGFLAGYNFDEGSGTEVYDESSTDYTGEITGAEWVSGYTGSALYFDGNDFVDIPIKDKGYYTMQFLPDVVSFTFWAYGDSAAQPQEGYIISTDNGGGKRIHCIQVPNASGEVVWWAGHDGSWAGGEIISKVAAPSEYAGQWNHWAFTKNANTGDMKIYLNGNLWHSETGKTLMMDIVGPVRIFKIGGRTDEKFNERYIGTIDEVRIYNRELTQSQVATVMAGGDIPALDPMLYWPLTSDADFNGDSIVDSGDFITMAQDWLDEILFE